MVQWTDFERATIKDIFAKIDNEAVGPAAFYRSSVLYPWNNKYFEKFGNLSNADAVKSNPNVIAHGKVVLDGLARAAQNLDNTKAMHAELSVLQSEKLHMDPDSFKLLTDSLTIEVAIQLGKDFTPEVQAAFEKFLAEAVSAQGKQNH